MKNNNKNQTKTARQENCQYLKSSNSADVLHQFPGNREKENLIKTKIVDWQLFLCKQNVKDKLQNNTVQEFERKCRRKCKRYKDNDGGEDDDDNEYY